jgi:hypothetical protein
MTRWKDKFERNTRCRAELQEAYATCSESERTAVDPTHYFHLWRIFGPPSEYHAVLPHGYRSAPFRSP